MDQGPKIAVEKHQLLDAVAFTGQRPRQRLRHCVCIKQVDAVRICDLLAEDLQLRLVESILRHGAMSPYSTNFRNAPVQPRVRKPRRR
jgi:hypothetical protein